MIETDGATSASEQGDRVVLARVLLGVPDPDATPQFLAEVEFQRFLNRG